MVYTYKVIDMMMWVLLPFTLYLGLHVHVFITKRPTKIRFRFRRRKQQFEVYRQVSFPAEYWSMIFGKYSTDDTILAVHNPSDGEWLH